MKAIKRLIDAIWSEPSVHRYASLVLAWLGPWIVVRYVITVILPVVLANS